VLAQIAVGMLEEVETDPIAALLPKEKSKIKVSRFLNR
jgi:hypothetical protein